MAYTSEALSLATLELFVHLPSSLLPRDLVAVEIRVPDDVTVEEWPPASLPRGWDAESPPAELQELGTAWIASGRSLLVRVPSVVIPHEWNVLINPAHPDVVKLGVLAPKPFSLDPRMAKRTV